MKDGDYIEHLFVCSSHDYLLFFSNRGKVYRSKVYELPEASRTAKGRALVNVLPLREGERIQSVLSTRDFTETKYLVFATRNGTVKKTEFLAYNTPIKADGIIAINIRDDDELRRRARASTRATRSSWSRAPGLAVALRRVRRARDGPRHQRRARHGRRPARARGHRDGRRARRHGPARRHRATASASARSVGEYRKTNARRQGRARRSSSPRSKGGLAGALVVREHQELRLHLPGGHGPAHRRRAASASTGRSAQGVTVMNIARRRPRVSGRAGRRVRRADRGGGGRRRDDRRRARPSTAPSRSRPSTPERRRRARGARTAAEIEDGDENSPNGPLSPSGRLGTFSDTRERRWSVSVVTVLAGPWR